MALGRVSFLARAQRDVNNSAGHAKLSDRRTNTSAIPSRNISQISTATAHASRTCTLRCRPEFSSQAPLYDLQHVGASANQTKKQNPQIPMKTKKRRGPAEVCPPLLPVSAPELPIGEFAALIGLDFGDRTHAIALSPRDTNKIEPLEIAHSAENLHAWIQGLANRFGGRPVAVAVESSKGAVVAALLEYSWVIIYPIHPATSNRFSRAFSPSGAKGDLSDARVLLDILRCHRDRLRALLPHDAETRRLAQLVEARRSLVNLRTAFTNKLVSLLKCYFPQALKFFGPIRFARLTLDFLARWPSLQRLQAALPQTLRNFYYAHHVRSQPLIEERIQFVREAKPLTTDSAVIEVSVLKLQIFGGHIRSLNKEIAAVEKTIESVFANYPEAAFFNELPGAGEAMAPRLAVLFGLDRDRWANAAEMQKYFGVAPVVEASGKTKWIHWRWNAPGFGRQTLVEWAGLSVQHSRWAAAYYQQQDKRGKDHSTIIRSLAFKWLRILWRCWKDHTPYNEELYLSRLEKRNPSFFTLIKELPKNFTKETCPA